jgi:hypothetical protein
VTQYSKAFTSICLKSYADVHVQISGVLFDLICTIAFQKTVKSLFAILLNVHYIHSPDIKLDSAKAKTWYMDTTFHVVYKPWSQVVSIHTLIRSGGHMKQVPIVRGLSKKFVDNYVFIILIGWTYTSRIPKCSLWKSNSK